MDHHANIITAQGRDDPNENTGISIQGSRVRPALDFVGVKNSFRTKIHLELTWVGHGKDILGLCL